MASAEDLAVEALAVEVQEEVGSQMEDILFLDIETVPGAASFKELDDRWKNLWIKKSERLSQGEQTPEELYPRAGIYAEFGKIICISVGFLTESNGGREFRIKSFSGDDEKKLLEDFCDLLNENYYAKSHFLCAHNGKEFDFPYLCRRIIVNQIAMPDILDLAGKKPWDVKHLDTMQLWKFGDFKNYTSLDLLAALFEVPSSKDELDGSMIFETYYLDKDLKRIRIYCEADVATLASIFLRMNNKRSLNAEEIIIV
ncbi:MAG: 3'-5' exonuclease [Bacteroidia bacterium]